MNNSKIPFPFNKGNKEKTYCKFNGFFENNNDSDEIHLSLITDSQYQTHLDLIKLHFEDKNEYTPVFYEFFGFINQNYTLAKQLNNDVIYDVDIFLKEFYTETDYINNKDGIIAEGNVIYYENSYLMEDNDTSKEVIIVIKDRTEDDVKNVLDNFQIFINDYKKINMEYNSIKNIENHFKNLYYPFNLLEKELQVTFVNVAQGNCAFVNIKDDISCYNYLAIDIGKSRFHDYPKEASANIKKHINNLTTKNVILSHWHDDHYAGAYENNCVLNYNWIVPDIDKSYPISAQTLALHICRKGKLIVIPNMKTDKYLLDSPMIKIYKGKNNHKGYTFSSENNKSLIVEIINTNNHKILFPGDCSYASMPKCVKNGRYERLVVPHHGGNAGIPCFMKASAEDIAIFLNGYTKFGRYENVHPKEKHMKDIIELGYKTILSTRQKDQFKNMPNEIKLEL